MAFNKIGFLTGVGGNPTGIGDYVRRLTDAGIPAVIAANDGTAGISDALATGFPHILGWRVVRDGSEYYAVPDYTLPPNEAASLHWSKIKPFIPPLVSNNRDKVWLFPFNEVRTKKAPGDQQWQGMNAMDWLGECCWHLANLANAEGYRVCMPQTNSGEPPEGEWKQPGMRKFLELCAERPDQVCVGLHEYSWSVERIDRLWPHLVGRFQQLFQECDEMGIFRPNVIIGEWGWKHDEIPHIDLAMEHIAQIAEVYAQHPQILGATIWYLGPGFNSIADSAQKLIEPVTDYTLNALLPPLSCGCTESRRSVAWPQGNAPDGEFDGFGWDGLLASPTANNEIWRGRVWGQLEGAEGFHPGTDFRPITESVPGDEIKASAPGLVVWAADGSYGWGKSIIISHGNGWTTNYLHLSETLVSLGDVVTRNQIIGRMGSTGAATDVHLHFDLRCTGSDGVNRSCNPASFFSGTPVEPPVEILWKAHEGHLPDGFSAAHLLLSDGDGNTLFETAIAMPDKANLVTLYLTKEVIEPEPDPEVPEVLTDPVRDYVWQTLADGLEVYADRAYVFTEVGEYAGWLYLQTRNNDKNVSEEGYVTFDVSAPARVYVLYDNRANPPAWLATWAKAEEVVKTSQASGTAHRDLYYMDFPAGTVVLHGNVEPGTIGRAMYSVMLDAVLADEQPPDPPQGEVVDVLAHMRPKEEYGPLYEVKTLINGQDAGQQRMQSQRPALGSEWYICKGGDGPSAPSEWESLRYEPNTNTIQRWRDTSPGNDEFYDLETAGEPWAAWIGATMEVGKDWISKPTLTRYRKHERDAAGNCLVVSGPDEVIDYLRVAEPLIAEWRSPINGSIWNDVLVIEWRKDPNAGWLERYYYSEGSLVMWESSSGVMSAVSEIHQPGQRPNSAREAIECA